MLVNYEVDLECLEEPLGCFVLEMHWCMFWGSIGASRLESLENRALEVYKCIFEGCKC